MTLPTCYFSILRCIPDIKRNEPRNCGVVVLCPDLKFAKIQYDLSNSGISKKSSEYYILDSYLKNLHLNAIKNWNIENLIDVFHSSASLLQYTYPEVALDEPTLLMNKLMRERVEPSATKTSNISPRDIVAQSFYSAFERNNLPKTLLHKNPKIQIGEDRFAFDLSIANGSLYCAVKTTTFQYSSQQVELVGGWYAKVWPIIARANSGAKGILIVDTKSSTNTPEQRRKLRTIRSWVEEAGAIVRTLNDAPEIAEEITLLVK